MCRILYPSVMTKHIFCILAAVFLCSISGLKAQEAVQDEQLEDKQDLIRIIGSLFNKGEEKEKAPKKEKKIELSGLPYAAVSPSAGVKFGVVANAHYRIGDDETTRKSAGTVSLAYTTKKQLFFYLRDLTYFSRNKWAADFDIRYNNNNENTYGLGGGTPKSAKMQIDYSTIRANVSLMYGITKDLYAGGGINYNRYYDIEGWTASADDPYYRYNTERGINPHRSVAAGFNIAALYDTRDNIINAYRGINARITYSNLMKILGSDEAWQHLWAEFRAFHSLDSEHRHRLGLWATGSFILSGDVPYMNLPATGYDLMGKSSYGYTIGRFRGDKLVFAQLEYRVGLTRNDLIGAVAFVNGTSVSAPDGSVGLFDRIEPAGGLGLRIKLNKFSRTNISIDYAVGRNSSGFYIDIAETF